MGSYWDSCIPSPSRVAPAAGTLSVRSKDGINRATSQRVMHLGLPVCTSGRVTEKLLRRFTRFFTQEVVYPCLGPPLR